MILAQIRDMHGADGDLGAGISHGSQNPEMPASDAPSASPAEWSDADLLAEARSVASDLADMLEAEQTRRRAAEMLAVRHFGTGWAAGACLGIPIGAVLVAAVMAWFG